MSRHRRRHQQQASAGVFSPPELAPPTFSTASAHTVTAGTPYSLLIETSEPCNLTLTGPDAAVFDLAGDTLEAASFDFDIPADAGADNVYNVTVHAVSIATGLASDLDLVITVVAASDTTAPTLSSPTGTQTGQTTADLGVTTDEANGTLYSFVSTSATPPSATDLKAGTGAVFANSQSITTTGAKTASATGLTAATAYYVHWLHRDAAGNDSAIATSASFTTSGSLSSIASLDDASWTKLGTDVVANADGTYESFTEQATSNLHRALKPVTTVSGSNFEFTALVKAGSGGRYIVLAINTVSDSSQWLGAVFDLTAVSVTSTGVGGSAGATYVSSSITAEGDGYRLKVKGSLPTTSANAMIAHNTNSSISTAPGSRGGQTYLGTGKVVYVDDLRFGAA